MIAIKLVERQPNQFFSGFHRRRLNCALAVLFIARRNSAMQLSRDVLRTLSPVAQLPHNGRGGIQAVRSIAIRIVDKYFVVEFFDN
jgi:hypothetical protein